MVTYDQWKLASPPEPRWRCPVCDCGLERDYLGEGEWYCPECQAQEGLAECKECGSVLEEDPATGRLCCPVCANEE